MTKEIVDRMIQIKKDEAVLEKEYASLQAKLQVIGEDALKDTKYKSVSFSGTFGKATVTIADKVVNTAPSLYQDIFGKAYKDFVNVIQKAELNTEGKRIAAAIWNEEYCEGSVKEIVNSLSCDEKSKRSLMKKLNGKNFETDKNNLMKIGGLSEEDAKINAYFVSEAVAWNKIQVLVKLNNNGEFSKTAFEQLVSNIHAAVTVEHSTKITIESLEG